jgi:hypothetical protein
VHDAASAPLEAAMNGPAATMLIHQVMTTSPVTV